MSVEGFEEKFFAVVDRVVFGVVKKVLVVADDESVREAVIVDLNILRFLQSIALP